MRISFRQGVVNAQVNFLDYTGGNIWIRTAGGPALFTIAHNLQDYLHYENVDVQGWNGPFSPTINYWLYLDFNPRTFQRTFGYTTVQPLYGSIRPTTGVDSNNVPNLTVDRHWFDTVNNRMYRYSGTTWIEVIRVFAAKFSNGSFLSVSGNAPSFFGTQIGNVSSVHAGRVIYDYNGAVIRKDDGTFFTTENKFFANGARVDGIRLESNVIVAEMTETASEFSVIATDAVNGFGKFKVAEYSDVGSSIIAMLTQDVLVGNAGSAIFQGVVVNNDWEWQLTDVGSPLWVVDGELVLQDPAIADPLNNPIPMPPVAKVQSHDTVIFAPVLGQKLIGGGSNNAADIIYAPHAPLTSTNVQGALDQVATLLGSYVSKTGDTMTGYLVLHADPVSDMQAATKQYVDNAISGIDLSAYVAKSGDNMTGFLTLNANPTANMHAATKQYVDNAISGIDLSGYVSKSGSTMLSTANLTFTGGGEVLGLPTTPSSNSAATSKAYVDGLLSGLVWLPPIEDPNVISNTVSVPPVSPAIGDTYIMTAGASGAWSAFSVGNVVQWNGTAWTLIKSLTTGDRFGISFKSLTAASGAFAGQDNNIAIWDGTTWSFTTVNNTHAVFVNNNNSYYKFIQYVFTDVPSKWVEFGGIIPINAGTNIAITGNVVSVSPQGPGSNLNADKWDNQQSNISSPLNGQVLTYQGGVWINSNPVTGASTLATLTDVNIPSPLNGQVLTYNTSTSKWVASAPTGVTTLAALTDVSVTVPTNGQVLTFNTSANKWVASAPTGVTTLAALTDVQLTTLSTGQALTWNGTKWANSTLTLGATTFAGLSDYSLVPATSASAGDVLVYDSTSPAKWKNSSQISPNLKGQDLKGANLVSYSEKLNTISSATGVLTLDYGLGGVVHATLTGNITSVSINNSSSTPNSFSSGKTYSITLILRQDATGGRTISWGSSFKWNGGTLPTLTTTANAVDVFTLVSVDAGATWLAFASGKDMK